MTVLLPCFALASQAGLVIQKQDGTVKTSCVIFSGSSISGMELLKLSELTLNIKNGFIVTIDGEGSKDNAQMSPGDPFWSYWRLDGDKWNFQNVGANYSKVRDGDVEGWEFGDGKTNLPKISFAQICPSDQASIAESPTIIDSGAKTASATRTKTPAAVQTVSTETSAIEQISPTATAQDARVLSESTQSTKSFRPEFNILNVAILFFVFAGAAIVFVLIKVALKKFINKNRK